MKIKKAYFEIIRCVYICALTAYTILREVIPLQAIMGHGLVTAAFFGFGLLIVALNFWLDRDHATKANVGLFIAFLVVCGISTLINFKYDFISNVKAIAWMCLFFFLIYPCGFHCKERNKKDITAIFITAIITISVLLLISIPMYFFNVDYTYLSDKMLWGTGNQGFSREFMRLWGVFGDPNTAACYSFIVLFMSCYLFKEKKNMAVRILLVLACIQILLFIVLSGSRSVKLVAFLASGWGAFYIFMTLIKGKFFRRMAFSCLAGILAIVASYGLISGVTYALPYAKKGVIAVCSPSVSRSIHIAYDSFYKFGEVEITSGYLSDESVGTLPDDGEALDRPDLENKGDVSNGRFEIWEAAVELFLASPIFGVSPRGAFYFGKDKLPDNYIGKYGVATHNFLLDILTGTGIVGFFIILLVLYNVAIYILKNTLRKKFNYQYLLYSSIFFTIFISSMFVSDLVFNLTFGGLAFWLVMGLINGEDKNVSCSELQQRETDGKKRILVYGPKDPVGGVEKIVVEYVKTIMASHDNVSFDFLQYGENFSLEKELTELGCRVLYLPSRKKHYFKYKKALEDIFLKTPYSAVWGNYSGLTNIDLLILAKKYHVPVRIAHSHSTKLYWGSPLMKYVVYFLHYYNKLWLGDYATDYWACSTVAGKFMFPKSVQEKMQIIPNAVDTTKFYPDERIGANVRAELGIEEDAIVIGHVARMCEVKNQIFLLNVAAQAMQCNSKVRLLFVGDGELRESLEMETKRLDIRDKVIFLGTRQDVPDLLRVMDVFVLPSLSESFGYSAVEAQACGVPCVLSDRVPRASNISGLTEFLTLEVSCETWAEKILQQAQIKKENIKEIIETSGYEIYSASEHVLNLFFATEAEKL